MSEKLKFQTTYFFQISIISRSQNSASFDSNISPVAQKLWEYESLEVA